MTAVRTKIRRECRKPTVNCGDCARPARPKSSTSCAGTCLELSQRHLHRRQTCQNCREAHLQKPCYIDCLSGKRHVSRSIKFDSADTPRWAIRNCGLMLLNSLMRRINGGTDTASTRVSSAYRRSSPRTYQKLPLLPRLLVKLLDNPSSSDHIHKIFHALELVERFGLPATYRSEVLELVLRHRASSMWAIRDKAAKALSFSMSPQQVVADAQRLGEAPSQNDLHGRLRCLQLSLLRYEEGDGRSTSIVDSLADM